MFTLRATKRLIDRLAPPLTASSPPTTTVLGDWYATVVQVGRRPVVLAISERTFLAVVVTLAPAITLEARIREGIADALHRLPLTDADLVRELTAMTDLAYGKTQSRQVTGVLVDLARLLPLYVEDGASLHEAEAQLRKTPCSPLYKGGVFPDAATIALFAARV